ncbi:MAG: hypothetical protein RI571_08365, partial [Roseovarius sp.]|nr:hypothetical protein [Roseovarius sp.]
SDTRDVKKRRDKINKKRHFFLGATRVINLSISIQRNNEHPARNPVRKTNRASTPPVRCAFTDDSRGLQVLFRIFLQFSVRRHLRRPTRVQQPCSGAGMTGAVGG